MAADLNTLRARVTDLLALDVTPETVDSLINEGHVELCVLSEWTRATLPAGPTVQGQQTYDLPPQIQRNVGERILEVAVAGITYDQASPAKGRALVKGDLAIRGPGGVYWIEFGEDGTERLAIFPAPGRDGDEISILAVVEPDTLTDQNPIPAVPPRFRPAIVDYVAAKVFSYAEDNPELRQFHEAAFASKVAELNTLRESRGGRRVIQMEIEGVHF